MQKLVSGVTFITPDINLYTTQIFTFIGSNVENKLQKTETKLKAMIKTKLNRYLPIHSFPFNLTSMHSHEKLPWLGLQSR